MAEENNNELSDEVMRELTARAQKIVDDSHSVRVATVVMLSAWRLFYAARLVMDQYVQGEEDLEEQEKAVITHVLSSSLYEEALKPYKVEELIAVLSETCVPFLRVQEDNISVDIDEEEENEDDS
jgi:hypothetical protein